MNTSCAIKSCIYEAEPGNALCSSCIRGSEIAKARNAGANAAVDAEQRRAEGELSGGNVNYYLLEVTDPKRLQPYTAECEDIIEGLEMTFAEGNVFKALWRSCAMRVRGHGKRGQDKNGVYDGDKIAYYGERIKVQRQRKSNKEMATVMAGQPPVSTTQIIVGQPKTFEMAEGKLASHRLHIDEEGYINYSGKK